MNAFLSGLVSLFAGNLLSLVLNFVFSIILIQKLSLADIGLQSALVSLGAITMSLADVGLFDIATRELTRQPREKLSETFSGILGMRLVLSGGVCLIVAVIVTIPRSFPGEQFLIFLFALFTLVFSFAPTSTIESLLNATGRTHRIAVLQSVYNIGTVVTGVTTLVLGGGLSALYIVFSILSLLVIILYVREAKRVLPEGFGIAFRPREWRYYVGQSISGGLGQTFILFCLRFGTYLVYTFVSQEQAGYLGISSQLYQAVMVLIWAPYAISILPVLTRLHTHSEDQLRWLGSRSLTWLMTAVLPIMVGGILLAPELLDLLKHGEGHAIAPIMQIFIWVLPFDVIQSFSYRMLLVLGRQHLYLIASALAAILNILLCVLLIPPFGAKGAAIAAVASMTLLVSICLWTLRRWLFPKVRLLDVTRLGFALSAMGIAVMATPDWLLVFRIAIGAIIYGAVLLAVRIFPRSDWQTTQQLIRLSQPPPQ